MEPDTDALFTSRIVFIEDLLDVIQDQTTFAAFHSEWMLFVDDLDLAMKADVLSLETISKSHILAHRVSDVIQTFLDLETLSQKLISSLTLEVVSILDDPGEPSRSTSPFQKSPSPLLSPRGAGSHLSSYIRPSYEWLLAHLHNPYPSLDIRDDIAKATGHARRDIDGWFIDVRKRIGWNALRKKYFSNRRADIVNAATRFFVEEDLQHPIDENIKLEFLTVESRANDLYSEKISASDLALKLNMVVKDMTPEMKKKAKAEERSQRLREEQQRAITSYPSPARSSPPSPLPSVDPYNDGLEDTTFQSISQSGRKRRSSSVELCDVSAGKRARIEVSFDNESASSTGLPSPPPSVHNKLVLPFDGATPTVNLTRNSGSRKRRLSNADMQGTPKRPRNVDIHPRLQSVSDPTPFPTPIFDTSEFDGWFHENFDNTPSVWTDSFAPLEVELYDVLKFSNQCGTPQYPSPQIQDHNGLSPTTELADLQPLDFSTSISSSNKLPESNGFQQNVTTHGFGLLHDVSPTLGLDPFPNFFSLYDNSLELTQLNDLTTSVDTLSPISDTVTGHTKWTPPSFIPEPPIITRSVDSGDKSQCLLNALQQELSILDPPISPSTKPPQSLGSIPPSQTLTPHDRAAKQQKLREIQEAVRKLEAELAVTSS